MVYVVGKVALKKTLGILAGPIGWVITGALVSINLAGPAYRVTVPACVLIATLRLKQKAERERLEQAKRLVKQKAEREANKTKKNVVSSYRLSRWSSYFSCFFHQKRTPTKQQRKQQPAKHYPKN
ncbi:hypothetical protein HpHA119_03850 [Helicobacter pylori]